MKRLLDTQAAAAEVIMRRMGAVWFTPNLARTQAEMVRMVTEKQMAAAEAAMAFNLAMASEVWSFWTKAAMGNVAKNPAEAAVKRSLKKAGAPLTRAIKANRRRLRK